VAPETPATGCTDANCGDADNPAHLTRRLSQMARRQTCCFSEDRIQSPTATKSHGAAVVPTNPIPRNKNTPNRKTRRAQEGRRRIGGCLAATEPHGRDAIGAASSPGANARVQQPKPAPPNLVRRRRDLGAGDVCATRCADARCGDGDHRCHLRPAASVAGLAQI